MSVAFTDATTGNDETERPSLSVFVVLPLVLLSWFVPWKTGRMLQRAGWLTALLLHALTAMAAAGAIVFDQWYVIVGAGAVRQGHRPPQFLPGTAWEAIRLPFASLFEFFHGAAAMGVSVWSFVVGVVGFEVFVMLLALCSLPFAVSGGGLVRDLGRCVKFAYLASTLMLVVGVTWGLESYWRPWLGLPNFWHPADVAFLCLGVGWFLWLSAAGVAATVDWADLSIDEWHCEQCGYSIRGLDVQGRCPECGTAIFESLPSNREVPAVDRRGGIIGFIGECWRTVSCLWTDDHCFRRMAVCRDRLFAARFFVGIAVLDCAAVGIGFGILNVLVVREPSFALVCGEIVTTFAWFLTHFLMVAGIILYAGVRGCGRPISVSIASFYMGGLLAGGTLSVVAWQFAVVTIAIDEVHWGRTWVHGVAILMVSVAITTLAWWVPLVQRRVQKLMAHVRFANG